MALFLGQGTYGQVSVRDGKAIKKFSKLSHLIQEYMALKYLSDCRYVVHTKGTDFGNLELHMELYDCSLKKWLEEQRDGEGVRRDDVMILLRHVLMGLIELHDRELAHGDLKPGNILVKRNPLRAVLGDCGFVSIAKYAKVDRTAAIYRDPVVSNDSTHDMFSFGICFLEMIAEIKINRQATYEELKQVVREKVDNPEHRKIIYNLLHSDKSRRPSARSLLYRLFNESPSKWIRPTLISTASSASINSRRDESMEPGRSHHVLISVPLNDRQYIRKLMKQTAFEFRINRAKKGYGALLSYLDNHKIEPSLHKLYTAITLMILSSIFGTSGFRQEQVLELCENQHTLSFIFKVLGEMLSDNIYVGILLAP
jgi:serine/threonine protein kinase